MSDADLHVVEAGEGPAVVLLHGLTATHRYVVHGSRHLERHGHRVVAYDARGHGDSAPASRYDYAALTDDLLALLDARGIDRAVLAGASMGAHTAVAAALRAPERVAGLCVITPAFHPDSPPDLGRWDRLSDGLRTSGVDGFVAAYGEPDVPEAFRASVTTVLRQRLSRHAHPEAVADALAQVPRSAPYDVAQLPDVACPTVVVADRDEPDPGHPLFVGEAYAAAIPGAELVVEAPGASPIAWQGGELSRVIARLVARTT